MRVETPERTGRIKKGEGKEKGLGGRECVKWRERLESTACRKGEERGVYIKRKA